MGIPEHADRIGVASGLGPPQLVIVVSRFDYLLCEKAGDDSLNLTILCQSSRIEIFGSP